jgi:hypothetical protein
MHSVRSRCFRISFFFHVNKSRLNHPIS